MRSLVRDLVTFTGLLGWLVSPENLNVRDDVSGGVELRILPLGASITAGQGSSDGNGYRSYLQQDLAGTTMQYVGSLRSGSMTDNYHEGHSGFTITQVQDAAAASIGFRPNIILLYVGANDLMNGSGDPDAALMRLANLVDFLLVKCPDATILLAQISGVLDQAIIARIGAYNSKMSSIVSSRAGKHIMLVDMTIIKQDQLVTDGIHPNDAAYKIMASQWHDGIQKAVAQGWISAPIGPDPKPDPRSNDQNCHMRRDLALLEPRGTKMGHQCSGGVVWTQLGQIAPGDGMNGDHRFNSYWVRLDADPIGRDGSQVVLADLRGTGRADRIFVNPTDGSLSAWLNDGDGTYFVWSPANNGQQILDGKCTLDRMRFADLTGSGKVDVVCIVGSNSIANVWGVDTVAYFNQYSSSDGFKWDGPHQISNGIAGANYDSVSFMDVDGNGRDDMIIKGSSGDLHAVLNFGKPFNSTSVDWHDVAQIFSGPGTSNLAFADLNNDGRDDIVVFNADGSFYSFLNIRGLEQGRPVWVRQDTIKPPQSWAPPNLRMSDVTGDGKADYIMIAPQSASLAVFANNGSTDASVAGDGIWFADMDGDGLDDKIWISVDGNMSVWLNGQANAQAPNGWDWFAQNEQKPISTGIDARREQYRLADIDGDGKADMLIVDLNTGTISAWLNNGANMTAGPQGWDWTPVGQIMSSSGDAAGIRFADVTGDGKADLITLDQASGMTIYRNDYDPSWRHWSWMKITNAAIDLDAHSPKDLRFADMDGDQKADAIWVHPWDGSIVVWLSKDASKQEGWVRSTTDAGTIGPPHLPCAGENIMFARISVPYGRADYVMVTPHDGSLSVWKNGCTNYAPGSSGMTDNANSSSNASPPELNGHLAPSVSCGHLVAAAGVAGGGASDVVRSTSTTSLGLASFGRRDSYISTRTIAPPVSQIGDGQIQAATAPVPTAQPPVTQTSDAQVQVIVGSKSTAAIVKGGPTLVAGASPVTVSGTTYSLPTVPAVLVINGRTSSIPTTPGTASQSPQGASPTTSSKVVSVVPVPIAGSQASSKVSQAGVAASQPSMVVVAGQTLHEDATTGFVAGGQSVRPGSSAVVVSGHTLSLDKSAHLIEDGTTIRLPQSTKTTGPPTTSVTAPAVVAVGKASVVVESSGFVVGDQTVRPGGPQVVVSSHTLSLDKSAMLVVDGSTTRLPQRLSTSTSTNTITPSATSTTGPVIIAVGKASVRVESSGFVIGSQTVRPGGPQVVVSSRTLSLDKSGNLIDGTSTTMRLPQGTSTGTSSVSGSGSAAAAVSTSTSGPDVYYGGDDFWKESVPKVSCDGQGGLEDPCTIIVPPRPLSKATTYPSVEVSTNVEVACPKITVFTRPDGTKSTSTSWSSTEVPTKLTITAMTSSSVSFWNLDIPSGAKDSTVTLTTSFDVQTISTTEDAAICGVTGVSRTYQIAGEAVAGAVGAGAGGTIIYLHRKKENEQGGGGRGGGGGGPRGKKCGDNFGPFKVFFKAVFCQKPCILNCPRGWKFPHPPDWYSPYKPRNPPLPSPPMPPPLPYPTPPPGPGNPPNNPPNKPTPTNQQSQSQGSSSQRSSSKSSSQSSSSSSCNTSTVTDIVKSCGTITSGSTSCRTISTIVSRGCSITAKTITTSSASACPRITIDPNEDQGEDGTPPTTSTSASCSSSSTVTNAVVSCAATSGSTSCKTVSTSVVGGCSITAKTVTTTSASSCPRITLDPNEDQGEDGSPTTTMTTASCSSSSTVTNAVVSCAATSGSTSCKTVSTSVVRGCSITAKTTTTTSASSCPRITLDPNEDQGEDGDESASNTSSSSSKTSSSGTTSSSTKSTSTSTTASTTVSSTSTTSSASPTPSLPKVEFAVGYFVYPPIALPRAAIYYNKQKQDDSYVCRDNAAIWESDPKNGEKQDELNDIHIGPFDAQPWTNCNYDRPNKAESGGLRCNGAGYVGNGTCHKVDGPKIDCVPSPENKNIKWMTQALCTMEPPQPMDPLPAPPDFCFSSTKLQDGMKLESGSTITTLDRGGTEDLIKSACNEIKNGLVVQQKETKRANPNIRIMVAAVVDASVKVIPDKQVCKDRFTQLLNSCPNYGGRHPVDGVTYTLWAVTVPQKDPPPRPPASDTILEQLNRCFKADSPPGDFDKMEKGSTLIKIDPNRNRLNDMIYEACVHAIDARKFAHYDDSKKGPDGIPIRLAVRAKLLDPADPNGKDPEAAPSNPYFCEEILYKLFKDCPEYGGVRNVRNVLYDIFANQRPLGKTDKI